MGIIWATGISTVRREFASESTAENVVCYDVRKYDGIAMFILCKAVYQLGIEEGG